MVNTFNLHPAGSIRRSLAFLAAPWLFSTASLTMAQTKSATASLPEGLGETGMAHLLEHMVFKGSPKRKNIMQELTEHGTWPNGTTWYDRTNYFETFSAADKGNLKWALDRKMG